VGRFVVRRLLTVLAIIPVITLLVFSMRVLVPGDPVEIMFMGQSADRATIERVRRELGWDRPLAVQYAEYVSRLARGDLGRSIQNNRPVADDLRDRYPLTLLLAVASLVLATTVGLGLGVVAALQRERLLDAVATALAVIGLQFGFMLSGAFIIEVVFAWHGVGELAVIAIQTRDFPLIQGVVVTVAVTYVVINAAVDLLCGWLDPRPASG
jgi:peptide/nickel transport system permease protein